MKLADLPDDFSTVDFMQLDKESLDQISYARKKWLCQCKGCSNGTHLRDYGIAPIYFLDRDSTDANQHPEKYFVDLSINYWLCGKHSAMFRRLSPRFHRHRIEEKFLDLQNPPHTKIIDADHKPMTQDGPRSIL